MVATSAGEVGIDLSSDRLITDLDTADHLVQRFGRLNRFGETSGEAHVIYSQRQLSADKTRRLEETLCYLKTLPMFTRDLSSPAGTSGGARRHTQICTLASLAYRCLVDDVGFRNGLAFASVC